MSRTVEISEEQAAFIDKQVASGAFGSASAVVSKGLRALQTHDDEIERWLREEVAPTYDEMMAHPEQGRSPEEVLAHIEARHAERIKRAP